MVLNLKSHQKKSLNDTLSMNTGSYQHHSYLSVRGLHAWMTGPWASLVPTNISKDTVTQWVLSKSQHHYEFRNIISMRHGMLQFKRQRIELK